MTEPLTDNPIRPRGKRRAVQPPNPAPAPDQHVGTELVESEFNVPIEESPEAVEHAEQVVRGQRNPVNASMRDAEMRHKQRLAIGRQRRLDADRYIIMEPHMKFMWINDLDGEVQKWLEIGAEPVQATSRSAKIFKGLNDHRTDEWVKVHGGTDDSGRPFWVYLLKMDREVYNEVKIQPLLERQREILRAMGMGGAAGIAEDDLILPSGNALMAYAANTVTGHRGFAQARQKV